MIVSVHQPHYIPWLGFFDKIKKSDCFVYLDNVQYKKREFQNRNKIRGQAGEKWLSVPVKTKGLFSQVLRQVQIDNTFDWPRRHLRSLQINYARTKGFDEIFPALQQIYRKNWEYLAGLNCEICSFLFNYLEIRTPVYFESQIDITGTKTERIINICKKLNAGAYLSGSGARDYLDVDRFKQESIELIFQDYVHPVYPQVFAPFIGNLSVLDLVFNCAKDSKDYF